MRRTRGGQRGQEDDKAWTQSPATQPSHRVDRVQGRGREEREEDKAWTEPSRGGQEEERPGHTQPHSPATELTEFRGARGGQGPQPQSPATQPSHRVDRVQGRGQEEAS